MSCRFCLPERRTGALFNEKFTKASHTVPNTHAHNLRLEVAAKVSDSFGSVESAFDHYSEGPPTCVDLIILSFLVTLSHQTLRLIEGSDRQH